mmetsp:Transcript_21888/g.75283  ORF Transcript_21888/g.75283 Transcript_21888/m.75283 type:complete len:243 (-) Transcript_21888:1637-2365(-)
MLHCVRSDLVPRPALGLQSHLDRHGLRGPPNPLPPLPLLKGLLAAAPEGACQLLRGQSAVHVHVHLVEEPLGQVHDDGPQHILGHPLFAEVLVEVNLAEPIDELIQSHLTTAISIKIGHDPVRKEELLFQPLHHRLVELCSLLGQLRVCVVGHPEAPIDEPEDHCASVHHGRGREQLTLLERRAHVRENARQSVDCLQAQVEEVLHHEAKHKHVVGFLVQGIMKLLVVEHPSGKQVTLLQVQ